MECGTLGGQLASLLCWTIPARAGCARVELSSVAVALSPPISPPRFPALIGTRPDVAVILIGAGDATDLRRRPGRGRAEHRGPPAPPRRGVGGGRHLADLGACRAFAPPLRQLLGWHSAASPAPRRWRKEAAGAQWWTRRRSARCSARTGTLCFDGFHPSADGYRVWAHALYPAVRAAAVGVDHEL